MLEVDPTKRIETLAALEHPFLEAKKEYFGVTNKA
jgi:hypothetical protein